MSFCSYVWKIFRQPHAFFVGARGRRRVASFLNLVHHLPVEQVDDALGIACVVL